MSLVVAIRICDIHLKKQQNHVSSLCLEKLKIEIEDLFVFFW